MGSAARRRWLGAGGLLLGLLAIAGWWQAGANLAVTAGEGRRAWFLKARHHHVVRRRRTRTPLRPGRIVRRIRSIVV